MLALDIGGTPAKCALIENGKVTIKTDYWIERDRSSAGYPIMVPVVDLVEIGNGGGSIARVDDFGKLHVGPQSAGAMPDPAAYGKGGQAATTSDANLWLGRINRDYFCGGEVTADMAAAQAALDRVGARLGVDTDEAARGIVRIANNNMINALKLISLNRGYDPRDFTMVAFGGGGMHAVALAQELGLEKGDRSSRRGGVFGLGHDDVGPAPRHVRDPPCRVERAGRRRHGGSLCRDRSRASGAIQSRRAGARACQLSALWQAPLSEPGTHHRGSAGKGPIAPERIAGIEADFHDTYEREYTYRLDTPVEMVGIHLVASAEVGKLEMRKTPATGTPAGAAQKGKRMVDYALEGRHMATLYDGANLESGMAFSGPAIAEDAGTTIVIHPDNQVKVDGYGNLHITFNS